MGWRHLKDDNLEGTLFSRIVKKISFGCRTTFYLHPSLRHLQGTYLKMFLDMGEGRNSWKVDFNHVIMTLDPVIKS